MKPVKTPLIVTTELWQTATMPEGVLERWLAADGAPVRAGHAVAVVQVEDCRHDLIAPRDGRLHIAIPAGGMVEPGAVVGAIGPRAVA